MSQLHYVLEDRKLVYLDEHALPEETRNKRSRMAAAGRSVPEPDHGYHLPKAKTAKEQYERIGGAIVGLSIFAVFLALIPGVLVGAVFNSTAGAMVGGIVSPVFLWGIYIPGVRLALNHLAYDRTDAAAHRKESVVVDLSDVEPLDRIAREPFGEKRVRMLIAAILDLEMVIPQTKSWNSRHLEAHRVQLDPSEEARQVVQHALALMRTIEKLGAQPAGTSSAANVAIRAFDVARERLDIRLGSAAPSSACPGRLLQPPAGARYRTRTCRNSETCSRRRRRERRTPHQRRG